MARIIGVSCVAAAIEMLGLFFTNGFGVLGVAADVAREEAEARQPPFEPFRGKGHTLDDDIDLNQMD